MPNYTLSTQPYLDLHNKCYKKIITINCRPNGPLLDHVKQISPPKLSPFKESSSCYTSTNCIFAITAIDCSNLSHDNLMTIDDIPNLFSFLSMNGYTIDSNLTKILQKSNIRLSNDLLCFITY
jgi:hypothetical protein